MWIDKRVHNGIEYGIMAAYAEGMRVLRAANIGKHDREVDAETTPLLNPEWPVQYEISKFCDLSYLIRNSQLRTTYSAATAKNQVARFVLNLCL
jgi:6-phosphogluconate dehydrogenase (decarboxylating)